MSSPGIPLLYIKCPRVDTGSSCGHAGAWSGEGDPPEVLEDGAGHVWERVPPEADRSSPGCFVFETAVRRQLKLLCPPALEGEEVEIAVAPASAARAGPKPLLRFVPDSPYRTERHQGLLEGAVKARVGGGGLLEAPFGFICCSTGPRRRPRGAAAAEGKPKAGAGARRPSQDPSSDPDAGAEGPLQLLHGPNGGFEMRVSRADGAPVYGPARLVVVVRTLPRSAPGRRPSLQPSNSPPGPAPAAAAEEGSPPAGAHPERSSPLPPEPEPEPEPEPKTKQKRVRPCENDSPEQAPTETDSEANEEEEEEEEAGGLSDPFALLSLGAASCPPQHPSRWVDDSTVAAMEAMFAAAEAASRLAAERRGPLFKRAAALFCRIGSACGLYRGPAAPPKSPSPDPTPTPGSPSPAPSPRPPSPGGSASSSSEAALRAAAGASNPAELVYRLDALYVEDPAFDALPRPPRPHGRHAFESDEQRAGTEARIRELSQLVSRGDEGAAGAARELASLLATAPVLDSCFILTDEGQKEASARPAHRLVPLAPPGRAGAQLRGALRATSPSSHLPAPSPRLLLLALTPSARSVRAAARRPIGELRAACERGWRLSSLVHDNVFGVVQDLLVVPTTASLRLAAAALEAARPREAEDPRLLAEACYWAGLRSLRTGTRSDEAAQAHFFAGWSVLRAHGLYPSREEAWIVRAIAATYRRYGMLEEAGGYLAQIYWFTDTPEDTVLEFWARTTLALAKAKAGQAVPDEEVAAVAGLLHRFPRDADVEGLQIRVAVFSAFIHLKQGSFLKSIAAYRQLVAEFAYPHSPHSDFVTSFIVNFSSVPPASMARGLRAACALHRFFDWGRRTVLSAHLLNLLGRLHLCCGDFHAARAAFEEALEVYEKFPDVFTADHPRVCFLRDCIDACSEAGGPDPTASTFL
eukprot:tig00020553_g10542.t1